MSQELPRLFAGGSHEMCEFNTSATYHCHAFTFIQLLHYSLHSIFSSHCRYQKVTIVTKKKEHALRQPYRTRAKAKIMSEIEEVHEQMKDHSSEVQGTGL